MTKLIVAVRNFPNAPKKKNKWAILKDFMLCIPSGLCSHLVLKVFNNLLSRLLFCRDKRTSKLMFALPSVPPASFMSVTNLQSVKAIT
jgi:hypothetical protein